MQIKLSNGATLAYYPFDWGRWEYGIPGHLVNVLTTDGLLQLAVSKVVKEEILAAIDARTSRVKQKHG